MTCKSELPMMDINKHDPKNKIMTLKNQIEMRQMTLNDPKFDIKKSLDTLKKEFVEHFYWLLNKSELLPVL